MLAFDGLADYVIEMKGKFKPYVKEVMALALEGLTFTQSVDVREVCPISGFLC